MSVITLNGKPATIGRSIECSIRIPDPTVSERHAELFQVGSHYRVRDLASTNGVYVDGQPVVEIDLREACRLAFGGFECEFVPQPPEDQIGAGDTWRAPGEEMSAIQAENVNLKAELTQLREELEAQTRELADLRKAQLSADDEGASCVSPEEYKKLVAERDYLKELVGNLETELLELNRQFFDLCEQRADLEKRLCSGEASAVFPLDPAPLDPAPLDPAPLDPAPLEEQFPLDSTVPPRRVEDVFSELGFSIRPLGRPQGVQGETQAPAKAPKPAS